VSSDFRLDSIIVQSIGDIDKETFLDIACGLGKWGYLVRLGWSGNPEYVVGIDVWRPNLEHVKERKVYDDLVMADAKFLPFTERSFNVVCATEFLINLRKEEGFKVLNEAERVADLRVVVSVPNRKTTFGADERNPFEKNVSRWSEKDFTKLGYRVTGLGFQIGGRRLSTHFLSGITSVSILNRFAELIVGRKDISQDIEGHTVESK
jgi:ubiquinone/menaquinone biosynthesis C-methylase UbiE